MGGGDYGEQLEIDLMRAELQPQLTRGLAIPPSKQPVPANARRGGGQSRTPRRIFAS